MRDELTGINEQLFLRQMKNVHRALLVGFLAVGLALVYWGVIRATGISEREDNPRLVEAELRIQRGQILDRNGVVLAETTGPEDRLVRTYPVAHIGPAVGYYSFRHGTTGVEESFDTTLRGQAADPWQAWLRQILHRPQAGHDVQLTLEAELQAAADALLGQQTGTVLLISLPTAEILALASHPGYDPNELDSRFEELVADEGAPLLNRATQGLYQPGLVLGPMILAVALDNGLIQLDGPVTEASEPVPLDETTTDCASQPPLSATWADVLRHRCPAPLAELGQQMGTDRLAALFEAFGLTTVPQIVLNAEAADPTPVDDARLAAVGQENLTVTPLQIGLAWAALGIDGRLPTPQLITAVQDDEGNWQSGDQPGFERTAVSSATAFNLRQALATHGDIAEYAVMALAGPEETTNAWYLGLAPAGAPSYALVVVVEGSPDLSQAEAIGRGVLMLALERN